MTKLKRRMAKNINMLKIFKDTIKENAEEHEVKVSISKNMPYYLQDMIQTFIVQAADYAFENALRQGTSRISPRHVYWPSLDRVEAQHINPEADDWALHLRDTYYAKE